MDFDNQVYALLSIFGGENTHFLFGQQNISLKKSVTGKLQGLLLFDFLFLPSFQYIVSID